MTRDHQEELRLTQNYADRLRIQLEGALRQHAEEVGKLRQQISMVETMTGCSVEEAQTRFDKICEGAEALMRGED